jgi:Methyltransferase domain
MSSAPLMTVVCARVARRNSERWFRWVEARKGRKPSAGFFDSYPRFLSSSDTAATVNRLNQRYRALIDSNQDILQGKRVLDIASHDGRWSFAARKAGASHVVGIEARQHLVQAAWRNLREYETSDVEFVQGDVFNELDHAGPVDTVLCFGFLYHTLDHITLLRKVARLHPLHMIIDTAISVLPGSIIEVGSEKTEHESTGAVDEVGAPGMTLKGRPTKQALELMLTACGFRQFRYYDWRRAGIEQWSDLKDYYLGERITLRASA